MKLKITIIIAFLSMTTFGQLTGKVKGLNSTKTDTIKETVIKVIYKNNIISRNPQPPAIFFNGKLIERSLPYDNMYLTIADGGEQDRQWTNEEFENIKELLPR